MTMNQGIADPQTEARRIAAVRRYDILDTPPEDAFDRITAMAARRYRVPIAVVSIVDTDRIWFKSRYGLETKEIGRGPGLVASAMLAATPQVLPDAARLDPRLDPCLDPGAPACPLVAGSFGLRFYAGVPLTTHDGFNLGVLCVIDRKPHPPGPTRLGDLQDLAALVVDQMELRLSARRAVAQAELLAREIDHRVMNSLQIVASMLAMQGRAAADGATAQALEIAAGRIGAVARIHRHFQTAAGEGASCIAFLRRFCSDLAGVLARPVEVHGEETRVPPGAIQPIGLIANELVTNAAKHAEGRIVVTLSAVAGRGELRVADEGRGLPPGFDPSACRGLGMKVVGVLAARLGGSLSCGSNPGGKGACFTVSFAVER